MKSAKRGEAGIGTLILFIAMILVAAISASVLLQTSSSLQSRGLATGSKAQNQVSSQISFVRMWGENGSTGNISQIMVDFRLGAGSDPINLANSLVDFTLPDIGVSYNYNSTVAACDAQTAAILPTNTFATQYIIANQNHIDGFILDGELVRLCFTTPRLIGEKEAIRFSFLPKVGELAQLRTRTSDTFTEERVNLFP